MEELFVNDIRRREGLVTLFQRIQNGAAVIALGSALLAALDLLPEFVFAAAVAFGIAAVVGFGIPKNYQRDLISSRRAVKVERLYQDFTKLFGPAGEMKAEVDLQTAADFQRTLQKRHTTTEYDLSYNNDVLTVKRFL